ncbi:hypothetical protein G3580_00425 [Nitrogeniibacter mangrovi]|uniref:Uncharacterized protein n=1 Tax=Nitrogeniibacter mangrovi TaxID=2016596 RepID=A0A6C1AXY0_9RHOO|nr:hypothetical protein [Nitrogeniibacter mangrovi]QID16221.1 hypothetical protein G3580_00425 [Nitrogeniibacter mangrovi]
MTSTDALYSELKPDIAMVANQLFDLSETLLRKQGNFLPHAAVLTEDGDLRLVGAAPDTKSDRTNSTEVLPLLHDGLRFEAKQFPLKAIGIAENVTITLEEQRPTKAIKVLFEHKRGLTVALYLPFEKRLLKGYVFGSTFSLAANPEVNVWA